MPEWNKENLLLIHLTKLLILSRCFFKFYFSKINKLKALDAEDPGLLQIPYITEDDTDRVEKKFGSTPTIG